MKQSDQNKSIKGFPTEIMRFSSDPKAWLYPDSGGTNIGYKNKRTAELSAVLLIGSGETGSRTYTFTEYHKTANDW